MLTFSPRGAKYHKVRDGSERIKKMGGKGEEKKNKKKPTTTAEEFEIKTVGTLRWLLLQWVNLSALEAASMAEKSLLLQWSQLEVGPWLRAWRK